MSALTESIKELYSGNISDGEAELATGNLIGFFKLLQEIDARLQKQEQTQSNAPQNAAQGILKGITKQAIQNQNNNKVNEYENNGSSN